MKSEKLPREYKDGLFSRFIKKIKWWILKKQRKSEVKLKNIENISEEVEKTIEKNRLIDSLKIDTANNIGIKYTEFEKKKFMKNLTDNPELLEKFSTDRLEKILKWYREDNERKSMYLKKLNS